jgi:hypothetical protein
MLSSLILYSTVAVAATGIFEPANFSVLDALYDNGINVSDLPLATLDRHSSLSACSVAVNDALLLFNRAD